MIGRWREIYLVALLSPGMVGGPTRAERNAMYWSRALRPQQMIVIIGATLLLAGALGSSAIALTSAPRSGPPPASLPLLALLVVGAAVMIAGVILRGRALRREFLRTCPQCGRSSLSRATFCPGCGTALPASGSVAPGDAPLPVRGP